MFLKFDQKKFCGGLLLVTHKIPRKSITLNLLGIEPFNRFCCVCPASKMASETVKRSIVFHKFEYLHANQIQFHFHKKKSG